MNSVFGNGGRTKIDGSSTAAAISDVPFVAPMSRPDSSRVSPPMRWRASTSGGIAISRARTSSTRPMPTVYSFATRSMMRVFASSLAASASPRRSWT